MSVDVHSALPPAAMRDFAAPIDDDMDQRQSWTEIAITFTVATITIAFVSFVAVVMAFA
jgi:hypothetical protein